MQQSKYIFVSGGVISGIGKGVTAASLAYLLQKAGYRVTPVKFENYLNIDAGTINPIEHGDTFLCEDGTETDMDLGTYEKFLGNPVGKLNFSTMGAIYKTVIDKERRFEYGGEDVEAIPHVTDEILRRFKEAGEKTKADIVIIEFGGTVGEYQNALYYEAARILQMRQPENVLHVHVSYVPTPAHIGEPKTKPTQLSVKMLNSLGIRPDFVIARCEHTLDKKRLEKLSLFCGVPVEHVISNPNVSSIFELPKILEEQYITENILKTLKLPPKKPDLNELNHLLTNIQSAQQGKELTIAIVGKYFKTGEFVLRDSYAALFDALDHASWEAGVQVRMHWISAEEVEQKGEDIIGKPDGIIVPIGWGERGAEGMITAASYARRHNIPYLGLCYGMQLAVVAYARDMCGIADANTEENTPHGKNNVIHIIDSQKKNLEDKNFGASMRLGGRTGIMKEGTRTYALYRKANQVAQNGEFSERHRHRYEVNNDYVQELEQKGLVIAATSKDEGLVEFIELPPNVHPFYIATQGHPEYKSYPFKPHPLFVAFLEAAKKESSEH